jgi:hypothetical protein
MVSTVIDNLVNQRGWKVVLGTSMIKVVKVGEDVNNALFFVNGDRVRNP